MCNCRNEDFMVIGNTLYGEYDGDYHKYCEENYSFCPICDENLQPERSKREDFDFNQLANEYVKNTNECGIFDFAKWLNKRCGALNSMET